MNHLETFSQLKNFCNQSSVSWYTDFMTLEEIQNLNYNNWRPNSAFKNLCREFKWSEIKEDTNQFKLLNVYLIKRSLPIKTHIMLNHDNGKWTVHPGGTRQLLASIYHEPVPVIIADNSNTLTGYEFKEIPFTPSNIYHGRKSGYTEIAPIYTEPQFYEDRHEGRGDITFTIDVNTRYPKIYANGEVMYEKKHNHPHDIWLLTNSHNTV